MTQQIVIEKGIAVARRGNAQIYTWLYEMEPGDSVLLPEGANLHAIRSSVRYAQQRYGKRFAVRDKVEGNRARVWRTA